MNMKRQGSQGQMEAAAGNLGSGFDGDPTISRSGLFRAVTKDRDAKAKYRMKDAWHTRSVPLMLCRLVPGNTRVITEKERQSSVRRSKVEFVDMKWMSVVNTSRIVRSQLNTRS